MQNFNFFQGQNLEKPQISGQGLDKHFQGVAGKIKGWIFSFFEKVSRANLEKPWNSRFFQDENLKKFDLQAKD